MNIKFKDYFSEGADAYSMYRPRYPEELFSYLSSIVQYHDRAWDCATGNGQSALYLSEYFSEVIGTDASKNQIASAIEKEGVTYRVEQAEKTKFDNDSVDLITVAQALHWFNIDAFAKEAERVLKQNGALAVWTYNLLKIEPGINEIINHLYGDVLDSYWPPERKIVEQGYKDIKLPFQEVVPPSFAMKTEWDLSQLIGYLCTWSAVRKYEEKNGMNPVEHIFEPLSGLWGDPEQKLSVEWPLTVRVWLSS